MTAERVNVAEVPMLPAEKILDTAASVYGKRLVHASYNVAGDLVTVTLPDHQIPTGATDVIVSGADDAGINGTYTITVVDEDTFTYTPTSPPANPEALADVPLPGEIVVGQAHISYTFRAATAVMVDFVGADSADVQVKTAPYQAWFPIVATLAADSMIEFPVPYNFVRVVGVTPLADDVTAFAQGIAGSPI